jgi:hypothetical protein
MGKSLVFAVSMLLASVVSPAIAQTAAPFTLTAQQGQSVTPISNGTTLGITAQAIGQAVTFTLTGTYTGATTAIFSSQAQLLGSPDFSAAQITPAVPATLNPGQSFSLVITYTPSTASTDLAQLTLPFTQSPATAGGTPSQGSLIFGLTGTTANLTVNYFSAPANNVTPLSNGGTIAFPPTLVNTPATVTVVIANGGSATGTVSSVAVSGNGFQLQGTGLFPAGIQTGGTLQFNVIFDSNVVGSDTGTLTIQFASGPFVVNLTGTAVSPSLTYEMINGTTTTPLTLGQPLTLPSTNVGSTTPVTIQVQNNGTASTIINGISVTGAGYSASSQLVFPVTIAAGASITFTLNFTPPAAGVFPGSLTIGGVVFTLTGTGLGPQLTYSYTSGSSASTTVVTGGTILFPSAALAQSVSVTVTVTNSGTLPATVTSIGIVAGSAASAYAISNSPPLPVTLAPNASLPFTIAFTPILSGLNSANLLINTSNFTLSGFGTSAATLPSYQITGASGVVQPFTQPAVGLSLAQAYPLAVTGTLTLSVSSTVFASDPSVQFATGGQTVSFTIPANTTKAVFANGSTTIQFQTGTVAENITLSPSFVISGGGPVAPTGSSALVLTVPQLAPTLLSVQVVASTETSISVLIEGYSTTRSLGKLSLQFSSLSSSFNLPTTTFSVDVSQSAGFWYSSSSSLPFGGEFAITVPFSTTLATTSNVPLANNIAVTATATNSVGTSNSVSTPSPTGQ